MKKRKAGDVAHPRAPSPRCRRDAAQRAGVHPPHRRQAWTAHARAHSQNPAQAGGSPGGRPGRPWGAAGGGGGSVRAVGRGTRRGGRTSTTPGRAWRTRGSRRPWRPGSRPPRGRQAGGGTRTRGRTVAATRGPPRQTRRAGTWAPGGAGGRRWRGCGARRWRCCAPTPATTAVCSPRVQPPPSGLWLKVSHSDGQARASASPSNRTPPCWGYDPSPRARARAAMSYAWPSAPPPGKRAADGASTTKSPEGSRFPGLRGLLKHAHGGVGGGPGGAPRAPKVKRLSDRAFSALRRSATSQAAGCTPPWGPQHAQARSRGCQNASVGGGCWTQPRPAGAAAPRTLR